MKNNISDNSGSSRGELPQYDVFADHLQDAIDKTGKDSSLSMGLLDIDFFGQINADHGEDAADAVLVQLADYLGACTRDKGEVFRYGGDAFAILLPDMDKEEAFLLLEETRRGVMEAIAVDGESSAPLKIQLNISGGLAAYPDDGNKASTIDRKANEALYRAKARGRGRLCLAREEKMITKTSHYTQGQLEGLSRLAKRMGIGEAVLLREALANLLRKYNSGQ